MNNNIPIFDAQNELITESQELKKIYSIISHPYSYMEDVRLKVIENYKGPKNEYFYSIMDIALNDPARSVRMHAAREIEALGSSYLSHMLPFLGEFTLYRRKYTAYILGQWFPQWKRRKYYEIIRTLPINQRTSIVQKYMEILLVEADFNKLFDASYSLEQIGDFRALPVLKHTGKMIKSNIEKKIILHDDYSTFLLILYLIQHPEEEWIKKEVLTNHFTEIYRLTKEYNYSEVFINIFSDLNLIGTLFVKAMQESLSTNIIKIASNERGSWVYRTLIWLLIAEYPISLRCLDEMKQNKEYEALYDRLVEISEDIILQYKIIIGSGYKLVL